MKPSLTSSVRRALSLLWTHTALWISLRTLTDYILPSAWAIFGLCLMPSNKLWGHSFVWPVVNDTMPQALFHLAGKKHHFKHVIMCLTNFGHIRARCIVDKSMYLWMGRQMGRWMDEGIGVITECMGWGNELLGYWALFWLQCWWELV